MDLHSGAARRLLSPMPRRARRTREKEHTMSTAAAKNEEYLPNWIEKTLLAVDAQRVFIAAGDPFMRKLLARRFEAEGHDVIAAENGRIMLDYFLEMPRPAPGSGDVLITDVEMPEMGGFELVDRARAAGWTLP